MCGDLGIPPTRICNDPFEAERGILPSCNFQTIYAKDSFEPTALPMRLGNIFLDLTSTGSFGIRSHPHSANNVDDRETFYNVSLFCPVSGTETRASRYGKRVRICPTKAPPPRPNPRKLAQPTSCGITANPHNWGKPCNLIRFCSDSFNGRCMLQNYKYGLYVYYRVITSSWYVRSAHVLLLILQEIQNWNIHFRSPLRHLWDHYRYHNYHWPVNMNNMLFYPSLRKSKFSVHACHRYPPPLTLELGSLCEGWRHAKYASGFQ